MKKQLTITILLLVLVSFVKAQYLYPVYNYSSQTRDLQLSNFDIHDTLLFLPLGESGLHILNIKDLNDIREVSVYQEYEKRSRKKVYGIAHCVEVNQNKAYLSYGPLGLKILDVSDPTMPFVLGTYYRYQDVYCSEIYENYALLGYIGMGLEIVDFSNLDDIRMVSRKNERDFTVKDVDVIPPYIIITGGKRGLRSFKFGEPFTDFKQVEFPKDYITDTDANQLVINDKTGYLANDNGGLTILNLALPLYPLEINRIKTRGDAKDLVLNGNYLYLAAQKYIEVFDLRDPEKPNMVFEHEERGKDFISLKVHGNYLFALYQEGNKDYGIMIFQME
jgi:hypothetical protein